MTKYNVNVFGNQYAFRMTVEVENQTEAAKEGREEYIDRMSVGNNRKPGEDDIEKGRVFINVAAVRNTGFFNVSVDDLERHDTL